MRIIFIIFFLFDMSFIISKCNAASRSDAINLFVSSVIKSFKDQNDFPDPSEFKAPLPPKGGYLNQFEFDVTQDGIPELFLRSSLVGKISIFDVSTPLARLLAQDITLGDAFGLVKDDSSLSLISCDGTTRFHQGFVRRTYQFQTTGDFTEKEFKIDMEAYRRLKAQAAQGPNNGIGNLEGLLIGTENIVTIKQASQVLLMDYIRNPLSEWNPMHYVEGYGLLLERAVYYSDSNGSGYRDPGLENDKLRASNFDLQAARNWLKRGNSSSGFQSTIGTADGTNEANIPSPSGHSKAADFPLIKSLKFMWHWPWVVGTCLFMLVVAVFLKYRS